jgi:hypothetical protein
VVALTITGAQRDAIYDRVYVRLSGIDDVWIAAEKGEYEMADRLAREYSDELRLLLDDLGWGERPDEGAIELTAPVDVLRRVFCRLRAGARSERVHNIGFWAESRQEEEYNRLVSEACEAVLGALGEGRP